MDKMNTLCNNSRHLTYLAESFCNNSRISELIGSIFRSRLFCFSQVRFAGIEMRPAEPESVNSWRRIYWYQNFPFLDSYFMHRASESWIRKAGIFIARTSCFPTHISEIFWFVGRNCLKIWRISNQIKKTKYILFTFQRVVWLPATNSVNKKWFQRELFGYQILVKWSLISIFKQELSVNKFKNAGIHFLFSDYLFQIIQDILKWNLPRKKQ